MTKPLKHTTKAIKIKPDYASAYALRAESYRANKTKMACADDDWVQSQRSSAKHIVRVLHRNHCAVGAAR